MQHDSKITALETGSGISWTEWLEYFKDDTHLSHTELAAKALGLILERGTSTSPEWWAQSAAISFEHHAGLRQVGQQCDGSFAVNASKTLPVDMDGALEKVSNAGADLVSVVGVPRDGEPRVSSTEKWRYWKINLADGSRVSINIQNKAAGKSVVAVNHDGRQSNDDADEVKAFWKEFLGAL